MNVLTFTAKPRSRNKDWGDVMLHTLDPSGAKALCGKPYPGGPVSTGNVPRCVVCANLKKRGF